MKHIQYWYHSISKLFDVDFMSSWTVKHFFKGNPPPRLTWYKGHELVDDSYEQLNGRTTNILSLAEPVQKKDAGAIYTCQAVNNNQSIPVATKLKLEISCKYF